MAAARMGIQASVSGSCTGLSDSPSPLPPPDGSLKGVLPKGLLALHTHADELSNPALGHMQHSITLPGWQEV